MTVRELKKGEFFTLKPIAWPKESQVFIRGEFSRCDKKYECTKFSDICSYRLLRGDTIVYTDFTF